MWSHLPKSCSAADGQVKDEALDLYSATPDQLSQELARRVNQRVDDILKAGSDADAVRLGLPGHRARLYQIRFDATAGTPCRLECDLTVPRDALMLQLNNKLVDSQSAL